MGGRDDPHRPNGCRRRSCRSSVSHRDQSLLILWSDFQVLVFDCRFKCTLLVWRIQSRGTVVLLLPHPPSIRPRSQQTNLKPLFNSGRIQSVVGPGFRLRSKLTPVSPAEDNGKASIGRGSRPLHLALRARCRPPRRLQRFARADRELIGASKQQQR